MCNILLVECRTVSGMLGFMKHWDHNSLRRRVKISFFNSGMLAALVLMYLKQCSMSGGNRVPHSLNVFHEIFAPPSSRA